MGLYNVLQLEGIDVQFDHAESRLHAYRLGDRVTWPTGPHFWASGEIHVPGIRQDQDGEFRYFDIAIRNDEIIGADEITESEWDRLTQEYRDLSRTRIS